MILTVRELTRNIRAGLEERFAFVWVQGEVTGISRPSSGHLYFALKDSEALLNCVWFKSAAYAHERFDPLTGEVFPEGPRPSPARTLREGQEILCAGRITVYPPRGAYQLVVELARTAGAGRLAAQLEALRQKLAAQGYFDPERKRPLPVHPRRIAVLTAPRGAAVRDFARIASERGCGAQIRLYPVPVQGSGAAPAIAAALARVNDEGWAQIAVLLRGGGSLEDLRAFNEEAVADAIFRSAVPVLTGIGHETDTGLADLTADMRAATPSHAAQLLWALRSDLMQRVDEAENLLRRSAERCLERAALPLVVLEQVLRRLSPLAELGRKTGATVRAEAGLERAVNGLLREKSGRLDAARVHLASAGSRLAAERSERIDALRSRLGRADFLERRQRALAAATLRLRLLGRFLPVPAERALESAAAALAALDPYAPLARGYALIYDKNGALVRSALKIRPGDKLNVRLHDGSVEAEAGGSRKESL